MRWMRWMRGRIFRLHALFVILIILMVTILPCMAGRCHAADTAADTAEDTAEDDYLESNGAGKENDTYADATAIELGFYENLHCLDVDWYTFTLTGEMALRITLLFSNSNNGNLDCLLYKKDENNPSWSPDNSAWIASSFSQTDNEEILIQAQAGTYYYAVFSSTPNTDNHYSMKIEGFLYTPTVCFYQWIDAPETLSPLPFVTSDDSFEEVAIGFPFSFFGERIDTLSISSNGYLTFEGDCATVAENDDLQSMSPPFTMIAPFWDDLNPEEGGDVYAWLDDRASPRRFIVQWNSIRSYDAGPNASISFEVVLSEGTNAITFQYKDLLFSSPSDAYSYGRSATVGLKYFRENQLLSRLCSYDGQVNNPRLSDRLAICFAPSEIPIPPLIIGYVPGSEDPDSLFFPRDQSIAINFSKPMDTALTSSALSIFKRLEAASTIWPDVQGHIRWLNNNQTLQFAPDGSWDGAVTYTVTLDQTAKDMEGICLPAIFQFTFTTEENMPAIPVERDTMPPQVTISLTDNKTDKVPVSAQIYLTFTESMDHRSIAGALSFFLCGQPQQPAPVAGVSSATTDGGAGSACSDVAYTLTKNEDYTVWTLSPNQSLAYDSAYTVEIRPPAADLAGNALGASVRLEFKTCQKQVTPAPVTPATGQLFPNQGLVYSNPFSNPFSNTTGAWSSSTSWQTGASTAYSFASSSTPSNTPSSTPSSTPSNIPSYLNTGWSNSSIGANIGADEALPSMLYAPAGGSYSMPGAGASWVTAPSPWTVTIGRAESVSWGQASLTSGWMTSYSWLNPSTAAFTSSFFSNMPWESFSPAYDNTQYNLTAYDNTLYNLTAGLSYSPPGSATGYSELFQSSTSNLIFSDPFKNY